MKVFAIIAALCAAFQLAQGLKCYICSQTTYNGLSTSTVNQNCFVTSSGTPSSTCTTSSGFTGYCHTAIALNDGIIASITRECAQQTPSLFYPTDQCTTTLSQTVGNTVDSTQCDYRCTADNCNSQSTSDLKACSTTCNTPNGYCDYIKGQCVCNNGYSGSACATAPTTTTVYRKCVQCNSETDSTCNTTTTATNCLGGQQYCSAAQTWQLDSSGIISKITLTRGCTSTFKAIDECEFSSVSDSTLGALYSDYTCYSTCSIDGCNTNNPDGYINGKESKQLFCVQCTYDTSGTVSGTSSCETSTTREVCSGTSNYCYSKVKYWVANKTDMNYQGETPDYKLIRVERGCGSTALATKCTSSQIQYLSFDQVECQESCTEDGCNVGWPARPQCYTCSTDSTDIMDGYDTCLSNPQTPAKCTFPYQQYCYVKDEGRTWSGNSKNMYPRKITRGCTHVDMGKACKSYTLRGDTFYQCNHTCTTDSCNAGGGASNLTPLLSLLLACVVGTLSWI